MSDLTAQVAEFTYADIVREIRKVAQENPDFVYMKGRNSFCVYVDENGSGSCIVGKALISLGVPASWFAGGNIAPFSTINYGLSRGFMDDEVDCLREFWIQHVQAMQDQLPALSWAEAVNRADAMYPLVGSHEEN